MLWTLGAFGLVYVLKPDLDMVYMLVAWVVMQCAIHPLARLRIARDL